MKNILLILIITVCFSCEKIQTDTTCLQVNKKYDSILKINQKHDNLLINKFYHIQKKEKGNVLDTLLINDYKSIQGQDDLIDLYIWDRIHTINQSTTQYNVYKEFEGIYVLKPNHNKKHAQITKIEIKNDSSYLFKDKKLLISNTFKTINSSNKYIKGKIIINNYKLQLDGAIVSKPMIYIDDNNCMDCEQLQFYKIE
ncbi:hypothetical protein [Lacinutrix undariae]